MSEFEFGERVMEKHAPPTILELFARSVREQNREEQAATGVMSITDVSCLPESVRIEEMADWFRSLFIPGTDARTYIDDFLKIGYDSLEALGQITDDEMRKVISKPGHQNMVKNHMPDIRRLSKYSREECEWEWDEGLGGWEESEGATWVPYDRDVVRRLETARLTNQRDIIVYSGHNQKYRIDLVYYKQTNMRTSYKRDIRRNPAVSQKLAPPNSMLCPIGLNLMTDPVIAADGHVSQISVSLHELT
eukprot:c13524_g1_i2.p1 GENE.c13524_g1_i2~~c13524_g1_i2.p1  ORF type:complete len:255 (+),score=41.32 c13524_g1_i2:23-766(+)